MTKKERAKMEQEKQKIIKELVEKNPMLRFADIEVTLSKKAEHRHKEGAKTLQKSKHY